MFSNQGARKSVDSLSPTIPAGPRGDFPFHGYDVAIPIYPIGQIPANSLKETAAQPAAHASAEGL